MRTTFNWDDVGTWDAVLRTGTRDAAGNVVHGDGFAVDTTDSVVWSEDGTTVVFGARDMIVVRARGVTLVAPRDRAADLKTLIAQLPQRVIRGDA